MMVINGNFRILRCPFPIGWLMNIERFEETPLTTLMIDAIFKLPAPLFLPF